MAESSMSMDKQSKREEMKDDHSLEKVPLDKRNMGWVSISNIAVGIATAIFYMQMGSAMTIQFGAINALISAGYAVVVAGIMATVIAYLAATTGMNVNLMSRSGFGYIGASLTSLIYASNWIMYCAFEGIIMVYAVHEFFPVLPKWALMIFFGSVVIPLNWFGIKQLDKIQKYSLPIFIIFLAASLIVLFMTPSQYEGAFWTYMPEGAQVGGTALLLCIGMQNGILGLMTMLASDYARFLKKDERTVGSIAIGFIPQIVCFGIMGLIGIWFGVRMQEANPGVYLVQAIAFGGVAFTILTQIRINVTNLYSGSLSLANFFENIFKFKPGRPFWVVVTGVIAILLMLGGILDHLTAALTFQGVVLLSWSAILIADALVVKKILKIGPKYYEHRQSNLRKWNPVGVVSLSIPAIVGTIAAFGYMGQFLQNTAAFFAMILAFILTIIMAIATKGKYYVSKETDDIPEEEYIA
ncbi:purine-cytosine permease family protein [Alteribacillus bidgolensis]|uniref:Purine-cytosine permease n=1 Tax=Alteribacillus bidgolensis TaxID=930129 RepID=A0A1G8RNQ6_9BACI|nr:cytosine permease [Alteribacillus bidgolensis]SDJ18617.1 Purine-cytosine permease [Alteribacillus bidgolensis]